MDVEIELVLAPVDTSEEAERAVEYAIAVADRYGADLHLLHVLDQTVVRGIEAGDIAAESVADEHRAFTADVRKQIGPDVALSDTSVAGFSDRRLSQSPGSVILDAAEERQLEMPEATLGKAALYVLEYASQPVLSV
jgi:nucleotide-binding universal stress UspA family protein